MSVGFPFPRLGLHLPSLGFGLYGLCTVLSAAPLGARELGNEPAAASPAPPPSVTAPVAAEAAPDASASAAAPGPALPPVAPPGPEASQATAVVGADNQAASVEPEDEVVVLATRIRRTPGSVHVIGSETLERYKYDDPHATLQLVPGVYVRQEDGFGLRPNIGIRGAISDRSQKVALMEDGVLFGPAPYSAPAAYYFPLINRMVQLQVIKGPAAVKYGPQTVGGAIDLITHPVASGSGGALDVAGGQYGYAKFHGRFGAGDADNQFLIEGVHLRSDGFKELPSGDETGFYRNEWMFKGRHAFNPTSDLSHALSVKLTYSDEQSDETYLGLTDDDFRQNPLRRYEVSDQDRMRWHRTSAVVTHEIEPAYWLSLTTTAYRHDLFRVWSKANHFAGSSLFDALTGPATTDNARFRAILAGQADTASPAEQLFVGPNQREYVSQGVQTLAAITATTGPLSHNIEAGVRFHYDRIQRLHTEDPYDVIGGQLRSVASPTVVTTHNKAETFAVASHVTDDLQWGPLTLTPGVRLELIHSSFEDKLNDTEGTRSLSVLLAGIGAHYDLNADWGVLAGVHRGMSPPAPGTPGDPEISVNYEAGVRYLRGHRHAELIGYYNDYQNLTDICTLSSGCEEMNLDLQFEAGRARIYGLEALLEDEPAFAGFKLPLSLSYTLTRTEFLETFQSQDPIFGEVEAGDELPYVPRHEGRASIGVDYEAVGGYVAGNYVGKMREQSGSGPLDLALATDAQFSLDLGAHYQVLRNLRLYGQVRNLLDGQYIASRRPYGARPNPPRWIQIGAQLDF
jgi:Fe(3+) dicitrate transport protein